MTDSVDVSLEGQKVRGGVMARLRQERGLGVEECATEAGLSSERWDALERGLTDCLADEIANIGKALGLSGVEIYKRWDEAMDRAGLLPPSPPRKELSPEEQERIVNEVAADILMRFGIGGPDRPAS